MKTTLFRQETDRAVIYILFAVAVLIFKCSYHGPHAAIVISYLCNVSVSFAVYFLATILASRVGQGRLLAAAAALFVVEAFELFDGFGVMSNVYDSFDFLANAVGVGLALGLDSITSHR